MNKIMIDNDFSTSIPPLSPEEYFQLEQNIIQDGCRDPLVLWGDILLDGHNRYKICLKHNIPFLTYAIDFDSREAAIDWIDKNQLGRRNLTPEQMSLIRGRRYNRLKTSGHGQKTAYQNDTQNIETAQALSSQHGVSPATIKRDGQFANDVERLKAIVPDIEQKIISNEDNLTKQEIKIAADLVESHPEAAIEIVTKYNHRAIGTGENEWYTPTEYIESVRFVFGGTIDLDPATSEFAQKTIKAKTFFTLGNNGLVQKWFGKVWLNPPYAQPDIKNFIQKIVDEYTNENVKEAIVLTHNYTDTIWFHLAASKCAAICFTRGRIAFVNSEGKKAAPTQGQAFFYYGENISFFSNVFSTHGFILRK